MPRYSLITRAVEVQEAEMSSPADTRERSMGSSGVEGKTYGVAPAGD